MLFIFLKTSFYENHYTFCIDKLKESDRTAINYSPIFKAYYPVQKM